MAGFLTCAFTLMIVGVVSFRNNRRYVEDGKLVEHTHEVLYELEQILLSSINIETGARGFIITGEKKYFEPYQNSKATLCDSRYLGLGDNESMLFYINRDQLQEADRKEKIFKKIK